MLAALPGNDQSEVDLLSRIPGFRQFVHDVAAQRRAAGRETEDLARMVTAWKSLGVATRLAYLETQRPAVAAAAAPEDEDIVMVKRCAADGSCTTADTIKADESWLEDDGFSQTDDSAL